VIVDRHPTGGRRFAPERIRITWPLVADGADG
jgi:hypothetical protein